MNVTQADSLLWRVSADGGVSYVFGTIHEVDLAYVPLPLDHLIHLLDEAGALGVEVLFDSPAGQVPDTNAAAVTAHLTPPDPGPTDLAGMLGERRHARLMEILSGHADLREAVGVLPQLPLSLVALMVTTARQQSSPLFGGTQVVAVEGHLEAVARGRGLPVFGLETPEEQLMEVSGVDTVDDQVGALREAIDDHDDPDIPDMFERYAAGDLRVLADRHLQHPVMIERNRRLADRLWAQVSQRQALVLVGAAHLPLDTGVLALLESHGAVLERAA